MRERAGDVVGEEGNMQVGGRLGSPRAIRWRKGELIGAGTVDCVWFRICGLWVPAVRFVGSGGVLFPVVWLRPCWSSMYLSRTWGDVTALGCIVERVPELGSWH